MITINIKYKLMLVVLFMTLLIYFVYHTINGQRGLTAMSGLDIELKSKTLILNNLIYERDILEQKVNSLKCCNYDLDFVDEIARNSLGLSNENENIIILID